MERFGVVMIESVVYAATNQPGVKTYIVPCYEADSEEEARTFIQTPEGRQIGEQLRRETQIDMIVAGMLGGSPTQHPDGAEIARNIGVIKLTDDAVFVGVIAGITVEKLDNERAATTISLQTILVTQDVKVQQLDNHLDRMAAEKYPQATRTLSEVKRI